MKLKRNNYCSNPKRFYIRVLLAIISVSLGFECSKRDSVINETLLWPEIEPFQTGYIKVSDIHEIYYELSGNPDGIPVFVIHGGPGGACSPKMRQFFNPQKYLIVLHDQRGCGKSMPNAELKDNNTQALVEDIERLRVKLGLDKIILFGGSWGSTLSLAYAENYPENIKAMVLRGIFLVTRAEEQYFYSTLSNHFPELVQQFIESFPDSTYGLNDSDIFKLFQYEDEEQRRLYMKQFNKIGAMASGIYVNENLIDTYNDSEANFRQIYTMQLVSFYYYANVCFLEEGQLLKNIGNIPDVPIFIVHGRYDMICPPLIAYKLHKSMPGSKLTIVEGAGHSMFEEPIAEELVLTMKELEVLE